MFLAAFLRLYSIFAMKLFFNTDLPRLRQDRHYYLKMAKTSLKTRFLVGDFNTFCDLAEKCQIEIDALERFEPLKEKHYE